MGRIVAAIKAFAAKVKGSGTAADISAADITGAIAALSDEYKLGGVKPAANQAASTATDAAGLVSDFNALLSKLKTAGIMTPDT